MVLAILRCFKYTRLFHYRLRQALQGVRNLAGNGVAASGFIYNGHDLCCHPEFYRKFRLKQIRGKPLIRAYTSAPFARVSTLPCIYHFLTQRVVIIFLVVLSMLNKFKLTGIEDMFKKFEFTLYFEKCSRLYSCRKCNGATNKLI